MSWILEYLCDKENWFLTNLKQNQISDLEEEGKALKM